MRRSTVRLLPYVVGGLLAAASLSSFAASLHAQTRTLLIRGGRVLDGSGNPWIRADVLVRGDRIAEIGSIDPGRADEILDARGLYVAPGFIDTHSHAGPGLASAELSHAKPLLAMGLTTVFVNPDGGGAVDLPSQAGSLEQHGLGVNVAQLVPHGSIRRTVVGASDRAATPAELDRMRGLVAEGMAAGGWGLSSGTFYAPGSYAPPSEIEALAGEVAPFGGAYTSHIRDESTYSVGLMAAVDEVIDVGRVTGIPVVLTHVKALGPPVWGFGAAIVRRVERAREQGVQVFADQYPYTASATSLQAALVPRWAEAGGRDSLLVRLEDPATFARIREGMALGLERRGGAGRIQFRRYASDPSIEGTRLDELSTQLGGDPLDVAVKLIRGGNVSIVSHNMHEDDVRTIMAQPWTMTSSDGDLVPMGRGVPHPRSYGAFTRKLARYARDLGVVSLEDAVRSMTSLPARVFGMRERGILREGGVADVVVFDLARVTEVGTFTDPHHYAEGMVHVLVNGVPAIRDGAFTEERAGRVLRKARAAGR